MSASLCWSGLDPTLLVVAAIIGWWVLFEGVMTTAGSIGARSILPYWGLFLFFGLVEAAVGIWLLERPGLTLVATVLAIGFWSIFYGVMQIAVGVESSKSHSVDSFERQFFTQSAGDPGRGRRWRALRVRHDRRPDRRHEVLAGGLPSAAAIAIAAEAKVRVAHCGARRASVGSGNETVQAAIKQCPRR